MKAALSLVQTALDVLHATNIEPSSQLLRLGIECAERLGEAGLQDEWLAEASELKGADERSQALLWGQKADRLVRLGDLDEALRIRREEELPVYERLGDVRERAVTMGKIADILQSRGDLDEALRIHEEERLPVAEKLKDVDSIIHILFNTSRIRAAKGIDSQETFDRIMSDLSQAYALAKKLTRLDFICAAATDLGGLLAAVGAVEEARPLLAEARDGYAKLGLTQHVAQMDAMLAQLDSSNNPASGGQNDG
ncbi:MAG: hypothetical protein P8Y36_08760 [Alphaproteobacteria bacterium]